MKLSELIERLVAIRQTSGDCLTYASLGGFSEFRLANASFVADVTGHGAETTRPARVVVDLVLV